VTLIEHRADGVRVHTKGGGDGLEADACLVTVPLGVLKTSAIKFQPPLPPWKRQAIERLGFGPIEKVRASEGLGGPRRASDCLGVSSEGLLMAQVVLLLERLASGLMTSDDL